MDPDSALQHLAPGVRSHSSFQIHGHALHQPQTHPTAPYDDPAAFANYAPVPDFPNGHVADQQLQVQDGFGPQVTPTTIRQLGARGNGIQHHFNTPTTQQYGLSSADQHSSGAPLPNSVGRLQQDENHLESSARDGKEEHSHFGTLKLIENPPELEQWRDRLFNVDETITLTEDE